MTLFSLAFSFFLLMDPVGNVPIFISLLKDFSPKKQRKIIMRELIIALGVIVVFVYFGEILLKFLRISEQTIQIAGGIILFLITLKMIFPRPKPEITLKKGEEPFLVPMAIPLLAGPSILAAVMIYSRQLESDWLLISSIVAAWLASTIILMLSTQLKKLLGDRGLAACERLMGLVLILIATQMSLEGLQGCLQT